MAHRRGLSDDQIFSELLALGNDEMLSDMSDDGSGHDYVQLSESTDSEEEIPSPRKRRYDTYRGGVIHLSDIVVMAVTMPPVPPGSHAGTFKRTCNQQDCNRVLPSVSHDLHSVCIICCGFCTVASRCEECAD